MIIEDLEQLSFFHAVGQPIEASVTQVNSWPAAAKNLKGREWQKIKLNWSNDLSEWLCIHHRDRFQQWNDLVNELKPKFMPLVAASVERAVPDVDIRKPICDAVNWDILGLLMESEYSDLRTPKYYAALGLVYFDGHFPCGWDTKHPGGRMIVY
jgi:hypothetical protein